MDRISNSTLNPSDFSLVTGDIQTSPPNPSHHTFPADDEPLGLGELSQFALAFEALSQATGSMREAPKPGGSPETQANIQQALNTVASIAPVFGPYGAVVAGLTGLVSSLLG